MAWFEEYEAGVGGGRRDIRCAAEGDLWKFRLMSPPVGPSVICEIHNVSDFVGSEDYSTGRKGIWRVW